jgi:putative tryptophan/tyrosine transport system substrate-binding protein
MMRRRDLLGTLGSAAVAWPLAARAQQAPKPARIRYFAPAPNAELLGALNSGLREFGWVEGQNLAIDQRYLRGQSQTYDEMAAEFVRLHPTLLARADKVIE